MVKPLKKKLLRAEGEALRRYHVTLNLLTRIRDSLDREGWEDSESVDQILIDVDKFLEYEELEREIFRGDQLDSQE